MDTPLPAATPGATAVQRDAATAVEVVAGRAHAPAEIRETHTGIVTLVGDRAYKVKKPVVTDFLDFGTVERRERACAVEVALNRRLAPDSYLGVAHLTDPEGGPSEPVIVMRRYPDECRLSAMVGSGQPLEGHLDAIAAILAGFHRGATRSRAIDSCGRMPAISSRWQDNLDELRRWAGSIIDADELAQVARLASRFISGRGVLFSSRIAQRHIVDGHGDLLADDIFCMPDGPVLLDCLEFDPSLRYVDCIDDAAFLAMDLEFLGRPDLAAHFLREYRRRSGDTAPASLVDFYIAYRAVVRAKVDCIRADQGRAGAESDARRHMRLALEHLRAGAVRLILVGGGPGTGKTTLARALAQRQVAQVISTDEVRRELTGTGFIDGVAGDYEAGLYSPGNVAAVYDTALRRAALQLALGRSVIVDGSWRDPVQRERARDVAAEEFCPTVELECTLPLEQAQARIVGRSDATGSDATPAIAAAMAGEHHPWTAAHRIDTGRPLADSVAEANEICCLAI